LDLHAATFHPHIKESLSMQFERHEIEWTTAKSKRLWEYYGSNPKYREIFFGFMAGDLVARFMFAKIAAPSDARFLDFSCGRGDLVAACLPHLRGKQEIHATDFSDTYVNAVNERFKGEPRFKGAILSEAFPSPFPTGHFDVVFATEVIEHLNDSELDGMLTECKRLLKPGGHVFFTTPNKEDYDAAKVMCPDCGCVFHKWQHLRTWSAETLRERIEKARFITCCVDAVAWLSWKHRLLEMVLRRRYDKNGLVYIGQTAD